jgi:hypothetical protein
MYLKERSQETCRLILLTLAVAQGSYLIHLQHQRIDESLRTRKLLQARLEKSSASQGMGDTNERALVDPRIGQLMIENRRSPIARTRPASSPANNYFAVVFIGDCNACVLDVLREWESVRRRGLDVHVLSDGAENEASRFAQENEVDLNFVSDTSIGVVRSSFNPFFKPRGYILHSDGRRAAIQYHAENTTGFLRRVKHLIGRGE